MKFILLLSLISFSSLSFSHEKPSNADVILAIKNSLPKDLECTIKMGDSSTDYLPTAFLDFQTLNSLKMTINEAEQPAITFSKSTDSDEYIATFTTNSDLTVVEGIRIVEIVATKVQANVGTITHPKFQEKIVKEITRLTICK